MQRYRNNDNYSFWIQLQPAYEYFAKNSKPTTVNVIDGQYIVSTKSESSLLLSKSTQTTRSPK